MSLTFIPPQQGRLVGTNIAAKKLGIPERTVRYRAAHGTLPAVRVGKLWRFPLHQITVRCDRAREGEA